MEIYQGETVVEQGQLLSPRAALAGRAAPVAPPKIGLLVVGGISRALLHDLSWHLPGLHRIIAIDTDDDYLQQVRAEHKILVGDGKKLRIHPRATGLLALGYGAEISDAVAGLDLVLLVAGMGGAAGTGIAPVVAQMLREQDLLTLAVTISPGRGDSERRQHHAQAGVCVLGGLVNALLPIGNSDIEQGLHARIALGSVMTQAPLAVIQLCRCLTGLAALPRAPIGVDFESVRQEILLDGGDCAFGFGSAKGIRGAEAAARQAISHPFLGPDRLARASAVWVSLDADPAALALRDTQTLLDQIRHQVPAEAAVLYSTFAAAPEDGGDFRVSILASGIL